MTLVINGESIDDRRILEEIERLRPDYMRVFAGQDTQEQETRLQEWACENVIERTLMQQAALRDTAAPSSAEVDAALEAEAGQKELSGEPAKAARSDMELRMRMDALIRSVAPVPDSVSESEIRTAYEEHGELFQEPEQVHAAHIVKHVNPGQNPEQAREAIDQVYARIQSGTSFEEAAEENSDCGREGVDLGWFPRGKMVPRFEDRVFQMKPGQISPVFQTEFGFHIAKVIDRKDSVMKPLEAVREQVVEKVKQDKQEKALETWVDGLKAKADIRFEPGPLFQHRQERGRFMAEQHMYPRRLTSILVKPAGPDCNMACAYCFYLEKKELFSASNVHRMSEEVLEEMIRQAMLQSVDHISFGWQGGEPTLMGLDFFRKAVDFQKKYGFGQSVGNGLQTNGLLLDDAWAGFLAENRFLVGLSLDGPEHVHDHYRKDQGGKGTWKRVSRNAERLIEGGVAVNALSVVNDYSVRFPEEIYQYYQSLNLDFMQFIPCVEPDPSGPQKTAPFSVPAEAYGDFLIAVFDLWKADFREGRPTTSVRFFDALFDRIIGHTPSECTLLEECGVYVVVEHNGGVYACDFFVDPQWKLGTVQTGRLIDMLNSDTVQAFGARKKSLPGDCMECAWLDLCRGGCPKDRLQAVDGRGLNHLCAGYKRFFLHAEPFFRELADRWRNEQAQAARRRNTAAAAGRGDIRARRNDPCPCGSGRKFKQCCLPLITQK